MVQYDNVNILRAFDLLRFPLIVAVVFIHNYPEGEGLNIQSVFLSGGGLSLINVLNIISVSISHVIAYIAVPTFFLISGYLFFFHANEKFNFKTYKGKLNRRIKSLLVPYLCWNLIALLVILALKALGVLVKGNPVGGIVDFVSDGKLIRYFWNSAQWSFDRHNIFGIPCPMTAPIDVPLWYMRNLMVACLLSFAVYLLLKRSKYAIVLVLLLFVFNFDIPISGFSIQAIAMFSLGAYLSIHGLALLETIGRHRRLFLFIESVMFCNLVATDCSVSLLHHINMSLFTILGALLSIDLAIISGRNVNDSKAASLFCRSSFFVYALHTVLVLDLTRKGVGVLFGFNEEAKRLALYFLSPFLCIALCLLVYCFMEKYCGKALAILTGGRAR